MPVGVTDELLAIADEADGDGLTVDVGGNPVQTAEQGEVSSEGIGLIVAAVILLVSFGSVLAMGLPILSAILGVGVASGLIVVLAKLVDVPDWATSVATMIAIGVGIDYSLLIVTRYRAALQRGLDPEAGVGEAVDTAGRAVVFAGATVMVSLLGMVVMNLPYLYGVAIGSALAVGVMVALSVTLLPAVLGFVGGHIDRLRVPFVRANRPGPSLAFRWSRAIQHRPWRTAIAGLVLLLVLAAPALWLRLGFPDAGNGPESLTSRRAYDTLTDAYGPGHNGTLLVVADLTAGGTLADVDRLRNGARRARRGRRGDPADGERERRHRRVRRRPDDVAAGRSHRSPAAHGPRRRHPDDARRHRCRRPGRWVDGGVRRSEPDHRRPATAVHRRHRRSQPGAPAGRVPLSARRRQGRAS